MHLRKEDLIGRAAVALSVRPMCNGNTSYSRPFPSNAQCRTGGRFHQLLMDTMESFNGEMDSDVTMLNKVQETH